MLRIVVDTNVVISAFLSSKGAPSKIFSYIKLNFIELVLSQDIVDEISRVLRYTKIKKLHNWNDDKIEQMIKRLIKFSYFLEHIDYQEDIIKEDPSDNIFLYCALESEADFIISGDKHLLKLNSFKNIPIVKPSKFYAVLQQYFESDCETFRD